MKKIICSVAIALGIITHTNAQFNYVPSYHENIHGPVKSIQYRSAYSTETTTWLFNPKGQATQMQSGNFIRKFSYNSNGQLTKVIESAPKHPDLITEFFWEGPQLRYQSQNNKKNKKVLHKVEYNYNPDGLCVEEKIFSPDDNNKLTLVALDSFYYDAQKRLTKQKQTMGYQEEFLTTYNAQGLPHQHTNENLSMWTEFQYNDAGQCIGYTSGYGDIIESQTVYELDKYGNWTTETTTYLQDKVNHPRPYVGKQIIKYYP